MRYCLSMYNLLNIHLNNSLSVLLLFLLFNDHLHLVEDFVIFGVIFSSRKERRNVVVRFNGVRGCRKG